MKLQHLHTYPRGKSIFFRLFWSFVSISLLVILVFLFLYSNFERKNTEKQIREEIEQSLQENVVLFEKAYLTPIENTLFLMEMSPSLNNFLTVQREQARLIRYEIERQFVQLSRSYPMMYHSIRFIDNSGNEQVVVKEIIRIKNYTNVENSQPEAPSEHQLKSLYTSLKMGKPRHIDFSSVYYSPEGHAHFYAGISLLEPEIGGFGGAIIIECDLAEFIQIIDSINYRGHRIAWLVDGKNNNIVESSQAKNDIVINHVFYPGTIPSEQPFLTLIMRIPASILAEHNLKIIHSALLIALFAIVITFIVAWWLSRQIIRPITQLVDASQRFSEEKFEPVKATQNIKEITQLSTAFNTMAHKLQESMRSRDLELEARIKTEQALQSAHEYLQLILNSTREGVFGLDIKGNITFCNRAALQLLGYKNENELIGQNMHALLQYQHANGNLYLQSDSLILNTLQTGAGVHDNNHCFWRYNKTSVPVEYSAQPILHGNEVVGAVVTFSDITEALLAEETLRRSQKMDAIGKLTGGIAHDFNNMLSVILGYGELLAAMLSDKPKQASYIHEINNAAERARKLTSKLLTFASRKETFADSTDINQVLRDEQHMLEKTLTAKFHLELDLSDGLWEVWLDKSSLEDAIVNMCINASHAMKDNGRLIIRTRNIHLNASEANSNKLDEGDYVELSIIDNGCGMDKETLQQVFDPFFTTKGDAGTGLGMSQVYGFVKQFNGNIVIDSEPGKGTQIIICFPRNDRSSSQVTKNKTSSLADASSGHETILVVDDESSLRDLAKHILESQNYNVLTANDGNEALKILETQSVDLILTDVIMPNLNGHELVKIVLSRYPDIKIQMVSGYSDETVANIGDGKLYEARLQKPYTAIQLLNSIRHCLDS